MSISSEGRSELLDRVFVLNDILRNEMSQAEASTLVREFVATLLLLRWLDQAESEEEAMAIFEDRAFRSLLPEELRWRSWADAEPPAKWVGALQALADYLERHDVERGQSHAAWLHRLAAPLRRALRIHPVYLADLLHWVGDVPFETPGDRRALLDAYDLILSETADVTDGLHQTPAMVAKLMAALAHPAAGDRVYDPGFGLGGLLIAAWREVADSEELKRRAGPLLDVSGIEINGTAFLIGLTRLLLAGIESPRLDQGNSLEREAPGNPGSQGFDIVLANPPFGARPGRSAAGYQHFAIQTNDSAGLFIQHALAQLRPTGRAVILVPGGFLFRSGPERELRRMLVEKGQVEAVVALPPGSMQPYTGIPVYVLVLRKAGGLDKVKFAKVAKLGSGAALDVDAIDDPLGVHYIIAAITVPNGLAAVKEAYAKSRKALEHFRKLEELDDRVRKEDFVGQMGRIVDHAKVLVSEESHYRNVWEVSASDLARAEWDLTPVKRQSGVLEELLEGLRQSMAHAGSVEGLGAVAQVMTGRAVGSSDLVDQPMGERPIGFLRIKDIGQGKVGRATSWIAPESAESERRWALLAGDVLLSKSGTIGKVAIVRNGAVGSVAGSGLFVIRADQSRLDAGFLQAYLASPACQQWLASHSRGVSIQHLNKSLLDELPVPLPPLPIQARVANQYRETGGDALAFLLQATGSNELDRLLSWLADVESKIPSFKPAVDETPSLSMLEPVVGYTKAAAKWLEQGDISSQSVTWLRALIDALQPLSGIAQVPRGPSLLSLLQDAEKGLTGVASLAAGGQILEVRARALVERLCDWLRASIHDLFKLSGLKVVSAPPSLTARAYAEFSVILENTGVLPLRMVRISAVPAWGAVEQSFLPEGERITVVLQGSVPDQAGELSFRLLWEAQLLSSQPVKGSIELAMRVVDAPEVGVAPRAALESSPYVTGSPLEPGHGDEVFFGRNDLLARISGLVMTHGNVVLLEGNRRAGKTSVLKHLEGRDKIPGWLAVYASLQGAEGDQQRVGVPTAEVFRVIATEIAKSLVRLGVDTPLPNGQVIASGKPALGVARASRDGISEAAPFADFRDYLDVVMNLLQERGLGLLLMLDEFDKLQEGIDSGVTSAQVPENIRFLIQNYPKLSAILTGSRRLKRLREEYWSALYGLGTSISVAALDEEGARSVVTKPVSGTLAYSSEAVNRVLELTARQPYLMQCLCNRVFESAKQNGRPSVTVRDVDDAAKSLVRDNEHFASLWDYAGHGPSSGRHRRQLILMLCAMNQRDQLAPGFGGLREQLAGHGIDVSNDALDADLIYLRELELIELEGDIGDGHYRLAIPLMADWIAQQQDLEVAVARARTESEEEDV